MSVCSNTFKYPIFLDLSQRLALVVGAGRVGRRKLAGLLDTGARVRVVDPQASGGDFPAPAVELLAREYRPEDLRGVFLAFACTDSAQVNQRLLADAARQGILCGCSDRSAAGDFVLPAVLRRGDLTLAISTAGRSPALATLVRDQLAEQVTDNWGLGLEIVAAVRRKWLTDPVPGKYNQQVLRGFWQKQLLPLLETGSSEAVDGLLRTTFGDDYSLTKLQVQLPEGKP